MNMWIIIGVVVFVIRPFIKKMKPLWVNIYKALAHVFMGTLGLAAWRDGLPWLTSLFWILCGWEIICFSVSMLNKKRALNSLATMCLFSMGITTSHAQTNPLVFHMWSACPDSPSGVFVISQGEEMLGGDDAGRFLQVMNENKAVSLALEMAMQPSLRTNIYVDGDEVVMRLTRGRMKWGTAFVEMMNRSKEMERVAEVTLPFNAQSGDLRTQEYPLLYVNLPTRTQFRLGMFFDEERNEWNTNRPWMVKGSYRIAYLRDDPGGSMPMTGNETCYVMASNACEIICRDTEQWLKDADQEE